jgi:hypothetical protein
MGFLNKDEPTMAETMAQMHENMLHLAETAQGYKVALEAMGWSPTMAEQIAGHFLIQLHEMALK